MKFMSLNFTLQMCNECAQLAVASTGDAQPPISGLEIAFTPVPPPQATWGPWKHSGREIKPMDMPRAGTGDHPADENQALNCNF